MSPISLNGLLNQAAKHLPSSTNVSTSSLSSSSASRRSSSSNPMDEPTADRRSSRLLSPMNSNAPRSRRDSSASGSSRFFTPFSSSSSLWTKAANVADELKGGQLRRISVPFQRAKGSEAARRLSSIVGDARQIVQEIGHDLHQEIDLAMRGDKPSNQPFGSDLNREWEIVTVRELCRRLSLEDSFEPSELPLPEGSTQSAVLDEFMIRQIVDILPPRAEGYPWQSIYSSEKHGFSLSTLYRKMGEWTEEMSPVLLIIRDTAGHVFGAVTSTVVRPSDHYYGTGDSSLLFRFTGEFPHTRELRNFTWTGDNQFFINATKDFLSVGAGGGHYGLWLDADLNHGRSQRCATFDNEPLAGGVEEDFVVQFVEAFGFSMT